jgi:HEAT repeat protein
VSDSGSGTGGHMPIDDSAIEGWIVDLGSLNGTVRQQARHRLVASGLRAASALIKALEDPRWHVRWEAAKALLGIRSPAAAPALTAALMDRHAGTRWVAGEALVALKEEGARAVLEGLIEYAESSWFCESAHHVLHDLSHEWMRPILAPVLVALDSHAPEEASPVAAEAALERLNEHKP